MDQDQETDHESTSTSRTQTRSTAALTTPSGGLFYKNSQSLLPQDKKRVDSADVPLNKRHCLIQNLPNDHSVQYCHMVARKHAKDEPLMMSLEWHWNMLYKSLHFNTRYNIFFAGSALHLHHDNNAWGLLPDKTIIDRYSEVATAERSRFPDIQQPTNGFEYRLIPLGKSMEQFPILRQNVHAPPPNQDQFTIHLYPYETLPSFRSHLHPKFAIYELGRKFYELTRKKSAAADVAAEHYPDLRSVEILYFVWTRSPKGLPGFAEWKGPDDTEGDDDDRQSATSSKTGYDSLRKGAKRKRTGNTNEQGSPTPAGKNSDAMQMANPSFETLSHKTLIEHQHVYGKGGWTQDGLSSWAVDASRHVTS